MQYLLDEIFQFSFVLKKLPHQRNTVMSKYDICDFVYVHQVIASLSSLSDLINYPIKTLKCIDLDSYLAD